MERMPTSVSLFDYGAWSKSVLRITMRSLCTLMVFAVFSNPLLAHEQVSTQQPDARQAGSAKNLLQLATVIDFAPYAYQKSDGSWEGIDYEIIRTIFDGLQIGFSIRQLPRKRITKLLEEGGIDGLVSTTPYNVQDVLRHMWRSDTLYHSEVSAFGLRLRMFDKDVKSFFSNAGKYRLGLLREFYYVIEGHELTGRENVIRVNREEQLIELLMIERIDLALSEDISLIYKARKNGHFDNIKPVVEVASRPVYLALRRQVMERYPQLGLRINQKIETIVRSGFVDNVIVKYLTLK